MKSNFPQWQWMLLTAFFFGSLVTSCSVPRYMYVPTAVNIPSFTGKDQSFADIALSVHGTDLQTGYAFSNHWAVLGSWYKRHYQHYDQNYRSEGFGRAPYVKDSLRYNRDLFSLGGAYFTHFGKKHYDFITFSAGYGRGRFGMISHLHEQGGYPDSSKYNTFIYYAAMTRIFVQPALVRQIPHGVFILSVRWAGTFYTGVHAYSDPNLYGHVSNRLLSFVEPAITWKIYPPFIEWLKFDFQIGFSLNNHEIDYSYNPIIGNIGLEINPVKLFTGK